MRDLCPIILPTTLKKLNRIGLTQIRVSLFRVLSFQGFTLLYPPASEGECVSPTE